MEIRDNTSKNIISRVKEGSIAEELEISVADELLSINGCKVSDIIEYKYLITEEDLVLSIKKEDGQIYEFEIEKDYDEDIGIEFTNPLIDKVKSCSNNCIFCFIDQLPKGMRKTLYFKDDDSRLSFLQGNFITLTNMKEEEIKRIIKYRISPINISVHTTNKDLRVKMLRNKNAGKILEYISRFYDAKIFMNCQIVLLRDYNDKDELVKTIKDLESFYPYVESVAVVPVGLTKHREGLTDLKAYDKESSEEVIKIIGGLQEELLLKYGTRFVFPSDEFYVMAGIELPSEEEYEGYLQIENGVGLITSFMTEIEETIKDIEETYINESIVILTGFSAYEFMLRAVEMVKSKVNFKNIEVYKIKNNFFGEKITVAGLVTGTDIIDQLTDISKFDRIVIPDVMLRDGFLFLDDYKISDLEDIYKIPISVSEVDGFKFINVLLNRGIE
ncbi:MAG: DUF512 domain-containing protein [Tissierellia bacterium]|nr:DUF512 domain-containing protein [Tissierellia bacterium]